MKLGTDLAPARTPALLHIAHANQLSIAVLFLDVTAVFDSLARQLILPVDLDDEAIAGVFHKLNFQPGDLHGFANRLRQPAFAHNIELHDHLV